MSGKKSILLVEGESDREFFELICKQLNLNNVIVAPPRKLTGAYNSKQGVFNHLPILLSQLVDGTYERLAVVLDADTPPNGDFITTRDRISLIVEPHGYITPPRRLPGANGGLVYSSKEGFKDFGLWVMPDNSSNGMLEDWLKSCVVPADSALLNSAVAAVAGGANPPKFSTLHTSKAEVATWLAWQKRPGHGLYQIVQENLLDSTHSKHLAMTNWLKHLF